MHISVIRWPLGVIRWPLRSGEYHKASLMISQHNFRWLLGAVMLQAITWTNVEQDLYGITRIEWNITQY